MKKILLLTLLLATLIACNTSPSFTVDGEINGADGKNLYLEASQIDGVVVVDSVKLKSSGSFRFKHARPEAPEFFRLRVDNKVVNFSVDSTETVTVKATLATLPGEYSITGADNEKIKQLSIKQMQLQKDVNTLYQEAQKGHLSPILLEEKLNALFNTYKEAVKREYIYAAPNTASAYFALFQRVNNFMIFDPMNSKEDIKGFAAVATSWSFYYPHATRTKNLSNIALKGMKNTRQPQSKDIEIDASKVRETNLIDISLKDIKGHTRALSDLKGKVVLLDFTVFQTNTAATHNYWLRELYSKYADKGFEIYQVSMDADEHFWKTTAGNLPWIGVRDPKGIYSTWATLYNIQEIPAFFIINKNNELVLRGETVKDVDAAIKALL